MLALGIAMGVSSWTDVVGMIIYCIIFSTENGSITLSHSKQVKICKMNILLTSVEKITQY